MRQYTGRSGRLFKFPAYTGEVPEGKAFYAWNTREDGTGAIYKVGKVINLIEDLHIWPMFVDANANDALEDDETTEEAEE